MHVFLCPQNAVGECQCSEDTHDLGNWCMPTDTMAIIISAVSLVVVFLFASLLLRHRRKKNDEVWHVNEEELQFGHPVEVIGQGSFGVVLLAHYRGTKVAIKRVISTNDRRGRSGSVASSWVDPATCPQKRDGSSEDADLGDVEGGNSTNPLHQLTPPGGDDDSSSTVSDGLGVLDDLTPKDQQTPLQRWLPFMDKAKSLSRNNLRILGKFSQNSVSTKFSLFQILCPFCDEAGRRRASFSCLRYHNCHGCSYDGQRTNDGTLGLQCCRSCYFFQANHSSLSFQVMEYMGNGSL
jgi:serine/threonine protein kinase